MFVRRSGSHRSSKSGKHTSDVPINPEADVEPTGNLSDEALDRRLTQVHEQAHEWAKRHPVAPGKESETVDLDAKHHPYKEHKGIRPDDMARRAREELDTRITQIVQHFTRLIKEVQAEKGTAGVGREFGWSPSFVTYEDGSKQAALTIRLPINLDDQASANKWLAVNRLCNTVGLQAKVVSATDITIMPRVHCKTDTIAIKALCQLRDVFAGSTETAPGQHPPEEGQSWWKRLVTGGDRWRAQKVWEDAQKQTQSREL